MRFGLMTAVALWLSLMASVHAAPRVVTSDPNLHSLVSDLMEGVAEPELLEDADPIRLIGADMVVWIGPKAEKALAASLQRLSRARERTVTVSRYVPTLASAARGDFLLDPRLARKAVRYITPQLVVLDPENYERYLENELRLRERLERLEAGLAERFAPHRGRKIAGRYSHHLAHRLGVEMTGAGAVKTTLAGTEPAAGAENYFDRVRARADAIERACSRLRSASR